jgi:hypothetical protein
MFANSNIKHINSHKAFNTVQASIQQGFYNSLHIHIRYINNIDLNNLFNYVLNLNNHELSMKIINILYNIESKNMFLGMYLDKVIKLFLNSNDSKADKIKICEDVINACNVNICNINILTNIITNIIKNITIEKFNELVSIFKMSYIKELTLYGSIELINFIKNTGHRYKEHTIINFIIDILNNNDTINFNILKFIIDNYKDCVNNNLLHIINNIKTFSENNNSYIIIDYIFYLMKITNQDILKIFKKIIYNGNELLFCYMSIKYFSRITNFNYFEYACLFSNPNSDLNNNLIGLSYLKTELSVEKLDDIFLKSCNYNILSAIKWFTTFLSQRYKIHNNQPIIIESGSIKPIISPFYMDKKCKITQQRDTYHSSDECCVCLENKTEMIKLSCHTSHNVCSECFETAFNIKPSCPLCRSDIKMSECIISL